VFELMNEGMFLNEIAPGIDIKKHVLDKMGFVPAVSRKLKVMDSSIFID